ncbi:GumC family protein [Sandaracinus amylolyticus]|uniref:GumC family protein n=1 Tax=Sandaracinus amylolyticus TaxID=927083 RepID=UPI001F2679DA|nr:hypothetical protein [Sandaracinus amylolyticus]
MIGVVVGVVLAKFVIKHNYDSSASMRFEGVQPLAEGAEASSQDVRRDLPSRLESLRRDEVLREVRHRMGMDPVPLAALQNLFENTQDAEAGLVTITAHSTTPEEAARFANTIVDTFIEYQLGARRREIETEIANLDGRIVAARQELDGTRSRYDAFRTEHGVTDLTTEQEAALEQAADLRAEADLAAAEIASLEARVRELREEVRRQPRMQVVSSQSESVDQTELARAEAHLEQLRGQLSEDHPRFQVADRQVRALRERVRSGGGSKVGSVSMGASSTFETAATALATASADLEAARQRSVQLQRLAQEAQQRVAAFSAIEGDATALLADVQVKQTLLNNLQNHRARLQNMIENPDTGFRVIARAVAPESAAPSKRKYYVAAGVPLALVLLVLVVVVGRELRGLKLHTASEISFWGNGPVVGTTTWPRDPSAAGDLVADMDDFVPKSTGTMLVVGATEHEMPLATELAKQLAADWTDTTLIEMGRDTLVSPIPVDIGRRSLPASAGPSAGLSTQEFEAAPTQVQRGGSFELLGPPTIVSAVAPYGVLSSTPMSDETERLIPTAWEGPLNGQQLRRAARLADRVLVVVPSGAITVTQLGDLANRLGRKEGVGYAVVGIADEYSTLPDRSGNVEAFWSATRE